MASAAGAPAAVPVDAPVDDPVDVLIVVPALNEEETIATVVADVRGHVPNGTVVVVDDGSRDATAVVAEAAGARVLRLPFNLGVGGALRTGLLLAQREGVPVAVQCDADGQHPAASIGELVAALGPGLADADIVIGARFAGLGDYRARGPRSWAMRLLARVMSRLHHTRLTDVTSGFRAFGPRAIEVLSQELPPHYLGDTVEALVLAHEHGLRVRQVPVAMLVRQGGIASHRPLRAMIYLARVMLILSLLIVRLIGARLRWRR